MSNLLDSNHIVHFFLDLYRRQIGLPEADPRLMSARALDPLNARETTYELKVRYNQRDSSRRMSLCRLGDDVDSKSVCYKVIYDDLLVLKIPPEPVIDFDQYLESIQLERRMADRLSPGVPCVGPSLAAIAKKIPELQDEAHPAGAMNETNIARHLRHTPSLQKYFKIGGSFVLFMSLSRHLFFDQVISRMHRQESRVKDAISGSLHTMGDILAFEGTFGRDRGDLFFSFADLQESYLRSMDQLLQQHGREIIEIPDHRKKQWMFDQLAEKEIIHERHPLPDTFINDQKRTAKIVFSQHKKTVTQFVNLIKSDIRKTSEHRNRNIASGIITNIVKLLMHLKEKNAAIRDLKPDNMFLVGQSDNPDIFLTSADQYALGLIDLETAINFRETEPPEQPILAGTPFYATPSHIFENRILEQVFRDAPRTLYLQDWFAAVGIIYNVVTGGTLFKKTGQLLPEVVRVRSRAISLGDPLQGVLKNVSWVFWRTACAEFNACMAADRSMFKCIPLALGSLEKGMLLEETAVCEGFLVDQIKICVLNQEIFKEDKTRRNLFEAGVEKIAAILKRWRMGKDVPDTTPEMRSEIVSFLGCLVHLKKCQLKIRQLRPILQEEGPPMTAQHLIFLLFRLVFFFMYRPQWSDREHPESF